MGGCWSRQNGSVSVGLGAGKKRRRRRRRRVLSKSESVPREIHMADPSAPIDRTAFCNPTFHENVESFFDPVTAIDSDGDEDFYSVQDGILSQRGPETESLSAFSSPRFANYVNLNVSILSKVPADPNVQHKSHGGSNGNAENYSIGEGANNGKPLDMHPREADFQIKVDDTPEEVKTCVLANEISVRCVEGSSRDDEAGSLHNCGLLPNTCLPCLAPIVPLDEKRRSPSSSPPSTRKKAALKFPFKWREDQSSPTLLSPKALLQRPIAGSQVPYCPVEKIMSDCWSPIEPSTFKVRGPNYLRDKKKDYAPNQAAFYPFGVDVFLSQRKIDHIARFVELPVINSSGKAPPILVVNLQIPLYPAAIFQNEYDGEGTSFVFYFKLNENYSQEIPFHFQENIRKLIDDEVERVRGFPVDTIAPFRERLKILGRVVNMEDLHLSAAERKLMNAYNEKPVLSRPQHEFYLGENYFEIDLDMHRFSFIPRKGFEAFQDRLKRCVLDFGLTIQGNKAEDLPEHLLCCVRLKEINYSNYQQLWF